MVRCLIVVIVLAAACKNESAKPTETRAQLDQSKLELAKLEVMKLAAEAFPQWAIRNPDTACPASLDDLEPYVNHPDLRDPWKQPLRMVCGPNAPAGVHGLGVYSLGPDGKAGTVDDIKSW